MAQVNGHTVIRDQFPPVSLLISLAHRKLPTLQLWEYSKPTRKMCPQSYVLLRVAENVKFYDGPEAQEVPTRSLRVHVLHVQPEENTGPENG